MKCRLNHNYSILHFSKHHITLLSVFCALDVFLMLCALHLNDCDVSAKAQYSVVSPLDSYLAPEVSFVASNVLCKNYVDDVS